MPERRRALLRHRTRKWLEGELRDYPDTKRRLDELAGEVAERGMGISYELQTHRRDSSPEFSDPTGVRGTWLAADRYRARMTETIYFIDRVYERLTAEKRQMVELYYWKCWSPLAVCDRLGIENRTLQRWRRQVVDEIARIGGYW